MLKLQRSPSLARLPWNSLPNLDVSEQRATSISSTCRGTKPLWQIIFDAKVFFPTATWWFKVTFLEWWFNVTFLGWLSDLQLEIKMPRIESPGSLLFHLRFFPNPMQSAFFLCRFNGMAAWRVPPWFFGQTVWLCWKIVLGKQAFPFANVQGLCQISGEYITCIRAEMPSYNAIHTLGNLMRFASEICAKKTWNAELVAIITLLGALALAQMSCI